ncbi:unnamed protein product [Cyprideis torosa]|uniref:Uncharacterized protein n=1 Tax=Cyprideis torosa TaxID=163714 RepID=A0A7R8W4N3_9CRUS|nr:unnamed protein product [Cyprideis torosa]CAG0883374.1 unnamed protein product [Cyprideis torosa]
MERTTLNGVDSPGTTNALDVATVDEPSDLRRLSHQEGWSSTLTATRRNSTPCPQRNGTGILIHLLKQKVGWYITRSSENAVMKNTTTSTIIRNITRSIIIIRSTTLSTPIMTSGTTQTQLPKRKRPLLLLERHASRDMETDKHHVATKRKPLRHDCHAAESDTDNDSAANIGKLHRESEERTSSAASCASPRELTCEGREVDVKLHSAGDDEDDSEDSSSSGESGACSEKRTYPVMKRAGAGEKNGEGKNGNNGLAHGYASPAKCRGKYEQKKKEQEEEDKKKREEEKKKERDERNDMRKKEAEERRQKEAERRKEQEEREKQEREEQEKEQEEERKQREQDLREERADKKKRELERRQRERRDKERDQKRRDFQEAQRRKQQEEERKKEDERLFGKKGEGKEGEGKEGEEGEEKKEGEGEEPYQPLPRRGGHMESEFLPKTGRPGGRPLPQTRPAASVKPTTSVKPRGAKASNARHQEQPRQ